MILRNLGLMRVLGLSGGLEGRASQVDVEETNRLPTAQHFLQVWDEGSSGIHPGFPAQLSRERRERSQHSGQTPFSEVNFRLTGVLPVLHLVKARCTKCSKARTRTFPPLKRGTEVPG